MNKKKSVKDCLADIENGVELSRDVMCCMSPLMVLEVTGQLLSCLGLIWGVLVGVFLIFNRN